MRMGQGVRTGLGHGGITCVLQTQFSSYLHFNSSYPKFLLPQNKFSWTRNLLLRYGSLPKTSNTLNIRTPKIIAKSNFKMFPKISNSG